MSKLATLALISLSINMFLFLGQLAVEDINPSARIFDRQTTLLNNNNAGSYVLNESVSGNLPDSDASISATTGNIFTDFFTNIKSWFLDDIGGKYLLGFLTAVPNFLKALHLPEAFTFILSSLWYSYGLIIILMFLWGDRD